MEVSGQFHVLFALSSAKNTLNRRLGGHRAGLNIVEKRKPGCKSIIVSLLATLS
jgi:hypothetical protein